MLIEKLKSAEMIKLSEDNAETNFQDALKRILILRAKSYCSIIGEVHQYNREKMMALLAPIEEAAEDVASDHWYHFCMIGESIMQKKLEDISNEIDSQQLSSSARLRK
jgi:hypothetical protein